MEIVKTEDGDEMMRRSRRGRRIKKDEDEENSGNLKNPHRLQFSTPFATTHDSSFARNASSTSSTSAVFRSEIILKNMSTHSSSYFKCIHGKEIYFQNERETREENRKKHFWLKADLQGRESRWDKKAEGKKEKGEEELRVKEGSTAAERMMVQANNHSTPLHPFIPLNFLLKQETRYNKEKKDDEKGDKKGKVTLQVDHEEKMKGEGWMAGKLSGRGKVDRTTCSTGTTNQVSQSKERVPFQPSIPMTQSEFDRIFISISYRDKLIS